MKEQTYKTTNKHTNNVEKLDLTSPKPNSLFLPDLFALRAKRWVGKKFDLTSPNPIPYSYLIFLPFGQKEGWETKLEFLFILVDANHFG